MGNRSLTVVGLGFMGGSLAAAARKHAQVPTVLGVDPNEANREAALREGLVDDAGPTLTKELAQVDVIVVCAPVHLIAPLVIEAASLCRPGTLLTDVGSTRGLIESTLEKQLPTKAMYVGSHPLAGSEKHGPVHADPDLFLNKLAILTPNRTTSTVALERADELWHSLGAHCREMSPEAHDRALAMTSHLPHLLSYALCQMLPPEMMDLTASGFRDMSRLAGSEVDLWMPIFEHNQGEVSAALSRMIESLQAFQNCLKDQDWSNLQRLLQEGHDRKKALCRKRSTTDSQS